MHYYAEEDIHERLDEIARSMGMSRMELVFQAENMQLTGDPEMEVMSLLWRLDEINLEDEEDPWVDVD